MRIPEVREQLLLVADSLVDGSLDPDAAARAIRLLVKELYRRPAVRMTPVRGKPLTPAQRHHLHTLACTTNWSQAQIAQAIGATNTGRVSEALAGKRT